MRFSRTAARNSREFRTWKYACVVRRPLCRARCCVSTGSPVFSACLDTNSCRVVCQSGPFARPKSSPARRFFFNEKRRAVSSFLALSANIDMLDLTGRLPAFAVWGWERNHEHLSSLPVDVNPHRFKLHMLQLDACLPNNRCSRAASRVAICRLESAGGATAPAANLKRFRVEKVAGGGI